MEVTVIIPHYSTGKTTAFAVSQFLKYKGAHTLHLIIGDNNPGDGSMAYLEPFKEDIIIADYPSGEMQSHGILIDFILSSGLITTPFFITAESDSYPTSEQYFDHIEQLVNEGYDAGGSLLRLSGGTYVHPAGAFYKTSLWKEAKKYADSIPYKYLPNIAMKEGFPCHLMVHSDIWDDFVKSPANYIELHASYQENPSDTIVKKQLEYLPVCGVFHNGMGYQQESYATYGKRDIYSGVNDFLLLPADPLYYRMGYEPGQFFCYYLLSKAYLLADITTETTWMPNRENQQQAYTRMENGFTHIWAGTSYLGMKDTELHDIYEFKKNQVEALYSTLQKNQII